MLYVEGKQLKASFAQQSIVATPSANHMK